MGIFVQLTVDKVDALIPVQPLILISWTHDTVSKPESCRTLRGPGASVGARHKFPGI